jgi:hypothetical protein
MTWRAIQDFCWERWTLAERRVSRLSKKPRLRKQAESWCEFWRMMHACAEAGWIAENRKKIVSYLATETADEPFPTLHRKSYFPIPEALPDLDLIKLELPNMMNEKQTRIGYTGYVKKSNTLHRDPG